MSDILHCHGDHGGCICTCTCTCTHTLICSVCGSPCTGHWYVATPGRGIRVGPVEQTTPERKQERDRERLKKLRTYVTIHTNMYSNKVVKHFIHSQVLCTRCYVPPGSCMLRACSQCVQCVRPYQLESMYDIMSTPYDECLYSAHFDAGTINCEVFITSIGILLHASVERSWMHQRTNSSSQGQAPTQVARSAFC